LGHVDNTAFTLKGWSLSGLTGTTLTPAVSCRRLLDDVRMSSDH